MKRAGVFPLILFLVALLFVGGAGRSYAGLPPEAQESLRKGVIAAKQQDYELAIRYFEEARRSAPEAPEVLYNLSLAESKIPGRELRAIAWFGAYLASSPSAPNAAAVKEQIEALDVKTQSTISRLLKTLQDAALRTPQGGTRDKDLAELAARWRDSEDSEAALKIAALIPNGFDRDWALKSISQFQAQRGDIGGAQETAHLIQSPELMVDAAKDIAIAKIKTGDRADALELFETACKKTKDNCNSLSEVQAEFARALAEAGAFADARKVAATIEYKAERSDVELSIAEAQAKAGDVAGARETLAAAGKTADLIPASWRTWEKSEVQLKIAIAQAQVGDIAGAAKTADLIQDLGRKSHALLEIAEAQAMAGDVAGAKKTVALMPQKGNNSSLDDYLLSNIAKGYLLCNDIASAKRMSDLIQDPNRKSDVQSDIVITQVKSGDIMGAQKTADLIQNPFRKFYAERFIAKAQAKAGDVAGARRTLTLAQEASGLIENARDRDSVRRELAIVLGQVGDLISAKKAATLIADKELRIRTLGELDREKTAETNSTGPTASPTTGMQPPVPVYKWAETIHDLNKPVFLDLGDYLKSLQSDDPQKMFERLNDTVKQIIQARKNIEGMLKQQAGQQGKK